MKGFWVLARKEAMEQYRTRRFPALVVVFVLVSILVSSVADVRNQPNEGLDALEGFTFLGGIMLGSLALILVTMGSLANERASGTAAMTLSKPVTRTAFVLTKILGLVSSAFIAIAIAAILMFVLKELLLESKTGTNESGNFLFAEEIDLIRYVGYMAILGVYLVFIGSIAFFFSALFTSQVLVGGIAFFLFIGQGFLFAIPHTGRYIPMATPEWALSYLRGGFTGQATGDQWPAFAIACGLIVLLLSGAWAVFRRKEL